MSEHKDRNVITVTIEEDDGWAEFQTYLDEHEGLSPPLEQFLGGRQASGTPDEWQAALRMLTADWIADMEFFSTVNSGSGEQRVIPDAEWRDSLEFLARVHDTITTQIIRGQT